MRNNIAKFSRFLSWLGLRGHSSVKREFNKHQEGGIQLEDILDSTPIAVAWSSVASGRIEYINKAFKQFFGYTLDDIPDVESWYKFVCPNPQYRQSVIEPWIAGSNKNASLRQNLETRILCKDGSARMVSVCFSTVGDKRLWHFTDITDYWIAKKRLSVRSKMLEMVAKSSELTDILTVIVKQLQLESPSSICAMWLYDSSKSRLMLGAAPDLPDFFCEAIDGIEITSNAGPCCMAASSGERVIIEDVRTHGFSQHLVKLAEQANIISACSDPIKSSKNELLGVFTIYKKALSTPSEKDFKLISFASNLVSIAIENLRAQEELERRAYFDHLTGLANRGYFLESCEKVLNDQSSLSIIMMDVDHFKKVNDVYGHKTGDLVLQSLAETCQQILRHDDIVGRLGGEEFAILLPNTDKSEVLRVAERLRKAIEATVIKSLDDQEVRFTVSLGIAYREKGYHSVDELLNRADKALYQSKAAGRNWVTLLEPTKPKTN